MEVNMVISLLAVLIAVSVIAALLVQGYQQRNYARKSKRSKGLGERSQMSNGSVLSTMKDYFVSDVSESPYVGRSRFRLPQVALLNALKKWQFVASNHEGEDFLKATVSHKGKKFQVYLTQVTGSASTISDILRNGDLVEYLSVNSSNTNTVTKCTFDEFWNIYKAKHFGLKEEFLKSLNKYKVYPDLENIFLFSEIQQFDFIVDIAYKNEAEDFFNKFLTTWETIERPYKKDKKKVAYLWEARKNPISGEVGLHERKTERMDSFISMDLDRQYPKQSISFGGTKYNNIPMSKVAELVELMLQNGQNVFLQGDPGSGKSAFMKHIIANMSTKQENKVINIPPNISADVGSDSFIKVKAQLDDIVEGSAPNERVVVAIDEADNLIERHQDAQGREIKNPNTSVMMDMLDGVGTGAGTIIAFNYDLDQVASPFKRAGRMHLVLHFHALNDEKARELARHLEDKCDEKHIFDMDGFEAYLADNPEPMVGDVYQFKQPKSQAKLMSEFNEQIRKRLENLTEQSVEFTKHENVSKEVENLLSDSVQDVQEKKQEEQKSKPKKATKQNTKKKRGRRKRRDKK